MDILDKAARRLGYDGYRGKQKEAVSHFVNGKNCLVIMATGGGKSAIYQVLPELLKGLVIVVSPLISLMVDQVITLRKKGVKAEFLNSLLNPWQRQEIVDSMKAGNVEILYLAPERLTDWEFVEAAMDSDVKALVVDEVHCVPGWGNSFRPEYLWIDTFRVAVGNPPVIGLSATATPKMCSEIIANLRMKGTKERPEELAWIVSGFDRPNLYLQIKPSCKKMRTRHLTQLLKRDRSGACIVYCPTVKNVEEVYDEMMAMGYDRDLCKYHGQMKPEDKHENQDRFMSLRAPICLCTCAFGMGIDRADVRQVIHYRPPGCLESYYQEVGRAGRDGKDSICTVLYDNKGDMAIHKFFLAKEFMKADQYVALVKSMTDLGFQAKEYHDAHFSRLERYGVLVRDNFNAFETVSGWEERIGELELKLLAEYKARETDIETMRGYLSGEKCLRKFILDHFGDKEAIKRPERCCSYCPGDFGGV